MIKNGMRPVHPGEVLREDFLVPLGMSANALSKALNVPARSITGTSRTMRLPIAISATRRSYIACRFSQN